LLFVFSVTGASFVYNDRQRSGSWRGCGKGAEFFPLPETNLGKISFALPKNRD